MVSLVKYANAEHTQVQVEPEGWNCPWPCNTWHKQPIQEWVNAGNTIAEYSKPVEQVKVEKLNEIKQAFDVESNANVNSQGFVWNGGYMSAMLLNGKADTLIHDNLSQGGIHDVDNQQHILSVAAIKQVAADISNAYETAFDKYQAAKVAVETCNNDTTCINNIVY